MICRRCHADMPDDATTCPDCFLPAPKGAFSKAHVVQDRFEKAKQISLAAHGIMADDNTTKEAAEAEPPPQQQRESVIGRHKKTMLRVALIALSASALMLAAQSYSAYLPFVRTEEIDPKVVLQALDTLRRKPSLKEGLTVGAAMEQEIIRYSKAGKLHKSRGWFIEYLRGESDKALLVFSLEEPGNIERRAEWVADLKNLSFIPRNELAAEVYTP